MIRIMLNDEQAQLLSGAQEPVDVVDRSGRDLGKLVPATSVATSSDNLDPFVAVALQRMEDAKAGKGVFYTTSEVLDHLHSLDQP